MYIRKNYLDVIKKAIDQNTTEIINIYGEKGTGKSYLIQSLKEDEELTAKYTCGYFDFSQYAGMSVSTMIHALYDMCDFLIAKDAVKLFHFEIADRIDSGRNNRIPYSDRKIEKGYDASMELTSFVSDFVELPYIGAGLKAAKVAARLVKKYRPKKPAEKAVYEELLQYNDEELKKYLPVALAQDINEHKALKVKKMVMIVENYDIFVNAAAKTGWLRDLVLNTNDMIWLFVSRKSVDLGQISVKSIEIKPMDDMEMRQYLIKEKYLRNMEELSHIVNLCNGIPLHAERILEFIKQNPKEGGIDWKYLKQKGYRYIAAETLKGLANERKEILFQLSLARYFDEELFGHLFPGRLFFLYKEWFRSSIFNQIRDGKYCVQNSMKEEICDYMDSLDKGLRYSCYKNLFKAEFSWFKYNGTTASSEEIIRHAQSLIVYGNYNFSVKEYFDILMELKNTIINAGGMRLFYDEMKKIADADEFLTGTKALKEKAFIDLYCSNYLGARKAIEEGIVRAEKIRDVETKLEFLNVRMNLEYIAPTEDKNSVENCIDMAMDYLNTLEQNVKHIPYRTYIYDTAKIKLYLAKQYVIKKQNDVAKDCLNYIFQICDDARKLSALCMYSLCGKAQEQMGEIHGLEKERQKAIKMYEKAVETYQVGEIYQAYWDGEFYLNFGLVYKRLAEEYFRLSEYRDENQELYRKEAVGYLDSALSMYESVRNRTPEVIDTYCKMGFAYVTAATHLWRETGWEEHTEKYLNDAKDVLNEALKQIRFNGGEESDGNRQICNTRCIISRISGLYHAKQGQFDVAKQFFEQSLEDGNLAIQAAPMHPYGYMEAALGHLRYAEFLLEQKENDMAQNIAKRGSTILKKANECINNPDGFKEIREALCVIVENKETGNANAMVFD